MRACVQLSAILYVLFLRNKKFYWVHLNWLVHSSLFTLHSGCWDFFSFIYLFLYSLKSFTSCVFFVFFLFVCLVGCLFVGSFCFYYKENLFEFRFSFNLNYMHTRWKSSFCPICHALHFANSAWFTRFLPALSTRAFLSFVVGVCAKIQSQFRIKHTTSSSQHLGMLGTQYNLDHTNSRL